MVFATNLFFMATKTRIKKTNVGALELSLKKNRFENILVKSYKELI